MGEAVPTLGYKLNVNYIIHMVIAKWNDGNNQEYEYLSTTFLSALKGADLMSC